MRKLQESLGQMGGIGVAGVMGIGLLLFCLSLLFSHLFPMQDTLTQLERQREALAPARVPTRLAATTERPQLPLPAAPEQLKQLNALATRHGIVIERATYQMKELAGQTRLEVRMPLNLSYPVLRAFLRDVLAMPAVALEQLALQRAQVSDARVEAQLRLSFGFAGAP